jgi:tRNA pseudouridine55 synthase
VLPICVGKATRLARFLGGGEKHYRATVRLGFATTTDDFHGEPLGPARPVRLDLAAVQGAARELCGDVLQMPPIFSAKRAGGHRHYDLARAGTPAERAPCRVRIDAIDVTRAEGDVLEIEVRCSAGTYIRALARDLGERLGVGGHLAALRRTRSGAFTLDQAAALSSAPASGLIPLAALLPEIPAVTLRATALDALRVGRDLGRALLLEDLPESPADRVRVLDEAGSLLALAVPRGFGEKAPGLTFEPVFHPDVVLLD